MKFNGLVVPWKEYKVDFGVIAVNYDDLESCWLLRREDVVEEGWQLV